MDVDSSTVKYGKKVAKPNLMPYIVLLISASSTLILYQTMHSDPLVSTERDITDTLSRHDRFNAVWLAMKNAVAAANARMAAIDAEISAAMDLKRNLFDSAVIAQLAGDKPADVVTSHGSITEGTRGRFREMLTLSLEGKLPGKIQACMDICTSCRIDQKNYFEPFRKSPNHSIPCNGTLFSECRCQLSCANKDKKDAQVDPVRSLVPRDVWVRDVDSYPGEVTVSFILQYFRQPKTALSIVRNLYKCTKGSLGTGRLPGVTTELVVNVDEPSHYSIWRELWEETKEGKFLVPFFSHNVQEVRGYNRGFHIARGKLIVFLQDDEMAPKKCDWLNRTIRAFDAWPRLGMLGMRGSHFWLNPSWPWSDEDKRMSWEKDKMPLYDPETRIRMHFVTVVDSSPSVYRKNVFRELGMLDEDLMGKKGESGIYCDWEMAIRVWMAGYQVVILSMDMDEVFMNPPGVEGGTHYGVQGMLREQNFVVMRDHWSMEELRIYDEVKRINGMYLRMIWPWL